MKTLRILACLIFILSSLSLNGQYHAVPDDLSFKMDLNGTWKFNGAPEKQLTGIENWPDIRVPGEWEMQGFKVEPGTRVKYARQFEIPDEWAGKQVFLRCDAIFSDARVFINGSLAGSHLGGMTAFELDVTGLLDFEQQNTIEIGIISESLADTLMSGSQYAAHPLGGILRKIYLFATPKVYLEKPTILTILDQSWKDARLEIHSTLKNSKNRPAETEMEVVLTDPFGLPINLEGSVTRLTVHNNTQPLTLEFNIKDPYKWTAEHPFLYRVDILVSSGTDAYRFSETIGFRQIEVVGNQVFLNGSPIKLKGVNRHEIHPLRGRSLNEELWEKDARMFKDANVNYIRTSHYPPGEEFLDWCDRLGLYVELENPLCWVGHGANEKWTESDPHNQRFYVYLEQLAHETTAFYGNHPSILIWSLANESAWGPNWTKLLELYNTLDPTRPKSFHDQAVGGYNNFGSVDMQIANWHYPGPEGARTAENFPRPMLFGEYVHLNTYNREEIVTDPGVRDAWGRAFHTMWETMQYCRGCLGGAIWSGIDDVFLMPDGRAIGYGEWGPIDGWRRTKPEYYHMKKTYAPVKIHNREVPVPDQGEPIRLQVENRYDFTHLEKGSFRYTLNNESRSLFFDLSPRSEGILSVYTGIQPRGGDTLFLEFFDPDDRLVDATAIQIGKPETMDIPFEGLKNEALRISDSKKFLDIKTPSSAWRLDKRTGQIIWGKLNDQTVFTGGPLLMIEPLKTTGASTEHRRTIEPLNNICQDWDCNGFEVIGAVDTVKIRVTGTYLEAEGTLEYQITKDGNLLVSYVFLSKIEINPRQWGLVFSLARSFENLEWNRDGLWSLYPEGHIGRTHGKAVPFPMAEAVAFRNEPPYPWEWDPSPWGCNDFKATRENLLWATLTNENGSGILVRENGINTLRAYVDGDMIRFLVTGFHTGGGDAFLNAHYQNERRPLKDGSKIKGQVKLSLVNGRK